MLRFFKLLFAYKISWAVLALIASFTLVFILFFQPPLLIILLLIAVDFVSFTSWGVLAASSDYFITHSAGIFARIDMNNLGRMMKDVSPEFRIKLDRRILTFILSNEITKGKSILQSGFSCRFVR